MTTAAQRIAVVTGGGSGIGAAAAHALADDGWTVVLAGRRREALATVAAGRPELLDPVPADITDEASVRALFATTVDRYGRVDLLFNNAGRSARPVELDAVDLATWNSVVAINLTGAFLCTREAFRVMRQQQPQGGDMSNAAQAQYQQYMQQQQQQPKESLPLYYDYPASGGATPAEPVHDSGASQPY